MPVKRGCVYLTPEDNVIVDIMQSAHRQNLQAGEDFGLISYNERRLNEILCDGLTTLSTDFVKMGEIVVELINSNEIRTVRNPCKMIIRNTL